MNTRLLRGQLQWKLMLVSLPHIWKPFQLYTITAYFKLRLTTLVSFCMFSNCTTIVTSWLKMVAATSTHIESKIFGTHRIQLLWLAWRLLHYFVIVAELAARCSQKSLVVTDICITELCATQLNVFVIASRYCIIKKWIYSNIINFIELSKKQASIYCTYRNNTQNTLYVPNLYLLLLLHLMFSVIGNRMVELFIHNSWPEFLIHIFVFLLQSF